MSLPAAPQLAARDSHDQKAVLRGLFYVTLAMIVLPMQDTVAKYVSSTVSVGVITWARFLMQSLFMLPFVLYFQGTRGLIPNRLWPNILRGARFQEGSLR